MKYWRIKYRIKLERLVENGLEHLLSQKLMYHARVTLKCRLAREKNDVAKVSKTFSWIKM